MATHPFPAGGNSTARRTVPWIRELSFGNTLGQRASALSSGATAAAGPADLVHRGHPDGEKSSRFLSGSFSNYMESSAAKEDENQPGYFHYCNGIDYTQGSAALEKYVLSALSSVIGAAAAESEKGIPSELARPDRRSAESGPLQRLGGSIRASDDSADSRKSSTGAGVRTERPKASEADVSSESADQPTRKQTIVTVCAYNAFSRSELRARYVVSKSRRGGVSVDPSFSVYWFASKRSHTYTRTSVNAIPPEFWTELAVSSLVRLCMAADDASRRVCGTVLLDDMVVSHTSLRAAAAAAASLLPKGHALGTRQAYGATSAGGDFVKTAKYRNFLVDTVVRLTAMDKSGNIAAHTADAIRQQFAAEFDVVVCRILKADTSRSHEVRFLGIVDEHVRLRENSAQTALLLVEQSRFLIGKKAYDAARIVAARAVSLLPLDFEAWYFLALSYVMGGDYVQALQAINSFPIVFAKKDLSDADHVDGIVDTFAMGFLQRAAKGKALDMKTFEATFPAPKRSSPPKDPKKPADLGSIQRIWYNTFQYHPHLRHPIAGPFHRSPLSMATPMELSTVDHQILKISSPTSAKLLLAAQSASNPWSSIVDFDSRSTWGRTYDLVTAMIALIGWDELVHVRNDAFSDRESKKAGARERGEEKEEEKEEQENGGKAEQKESGGKKEQEKKRNSGFVVANNSAVQCKSWLQSLLFVIYEDLRVLIQTASEDQNRSALSWQMIGLLGWSCKFNLKDSISSIVTSVTGVSSHGGFDYFGTIKMLEIFGEFCFDASSIDPFGEPYEGRNFSNKLIIQHMSERVYAGFRAELMAGHFNVDNILLCLTKLISYNLRWYGYMPDYLTMSTLQKLCEQHDPLVIRSRLQILFKTHEKRAEKKASGNFTLRAMFAAPKTGAEQAYEFVPSDTIMEYMDCMLSWIENLSTPV